MIQSERKVLVDASSFQPNRARGLTLVAPRAGTIVMPADFDWFPFYVDDFLTDRNVEFMSVAEVGVYMLVLCRLWKDGSIPDDVDFVSRLIHRPVKDVKRAWPAVMRCLTKREDGQLTQRRLERERARAQQNLESAREHGKKGARERWDREKAARQIALSLDGNPNGGANGDPNATPMAITVPYQDHTVPGERTAPEFDPVLETEVASMLALIASANRSGKITDGRARTERLEIAERVTQFGRDAMLYGLREAIRHEKADVRYAVACARNYRPEQRAGSTVVAIETRRRGGGYQNPPATLPDSEMR